jgi:Enoyl-CoA hydratase/isomerase
LPRLIGLGKAAELVLTGATLSAAEAVHCGLVTCAVPRAELDRVVERWTHAILQAGPTAVRLQKALLQDWAQLPLEHAIERGIASFSEAYRTAEPRALMTQFPSTASTCCRTLRNCNSSSCQFVDQIQWRYELIRSQARNIASTASTCMSSSSSFEGSRNGWSRAPTGGCGAG